MEEVLLEDTCSAGGGASEKNSVSEAWVGTKNGELMLNTERKRSNSRRERAREGLLKLSSRISGSPLNYAHMEQTQEDRLKTNKNC